MKDIYILQIETATPTCAVAISKNGATISAVQGEEANMHASHLTLFIEQVLQKAGITMADLGAIAVSMGPGSYTGLRIGVSTAKGLCYALDIPLLALNTLDAMAAGFLTQNGVDSGTVVVPMIDARRMEVYMAIYDDQGVLKTPTSAQIIDETSFVEMGQVVLFGTGADKFEGLFQAVPSVTVSTGFQNSAEYLSTLSYTKFLQQEFEDLIYFEPFYLKDFIASTPKKGCS